ncbi:hypothetical protein ABBQ32_008868 [Trebouxia sp. C0010 RCD-2024]
MGIYFFALLVWLLATSALAQPFTCTGAKFYPCRSYKPDDCGKTLGCYVGSSTAKCFNDTSVKGFAQCTDYNNQVDCLAHGCIVGGALGPSSPVMNEEQFQYSPLPSPSPSPSLAAGNCTGNLSSVTGLAYYVLGRQDGDVWCIEHPLAFYSFCFNATDFLSTSNLALCPV